MGEEQRFLAHARSGEGRLGTGMAASYYNHVELLRKIHRLVCDGWIKGMGRRPFYGKMKNVEGFT
jgi:hypothetical protein